jgi:hypothetical protein
MFKSQQIEAQPATKEGELMFGTLPLPPVPSPNSPSKKKRRIKNMIRTFFTSRVAMIVEASVGALALAGLASAAMALFGLD